MKLTYFHAIVMSGLGGAIALMNTFLFGVSVFSSLPVLVPLIILGFAFTLVLTPYLLLRSGQLELSERL